MKKTQPDSTTTHKPGPKEQLHMLAPFTFQQALGAILKAKPAKVEKKAVKKKTRHKAD